MKLPLLPIFLTAAVALATAAGAAEIDFNRDVRPIFSENCFNCHGPDANKRKAGLRLDEKDAATAELESGDRAIVPSDVEKSELIRRITSTDRDEVMPPPKEHKTVSPDQVALLKRWIESGAPWSGHWAFEPVKAPAVPEIRDPQSAIHNPIDAYVQARLKQEGLALSPEAERPALIRRVSLDLTGLPPSVQEVDAFVADTAPNAFEKVVDRLLASPHFGERLAVPWLDLARYGDTSGYHNDSIRDMWLWREWVIKAFNANMPFDRFTIEQIAGDMLPDATIDQQIASGFHRNVMTSDEGGLIEEEYLNLYVTDRVNTTGTAWMGLTVSCAQCHDHKYDPLTQKDYYQLYAFFNNVPESGKDGVRDRNPKPFLQVPTEEQSAQLANFGEQLAAADKALKEIEATLDEAQKEWEQKLIADGLNIEIGTPLAHFPLDEGAAGTDENGNPIEAVLKGESTFAEGAVAKSLRVEAKGHIEVGERFGFEKDEAFSAAAWLRLKPLGGSPFGKMEVGGATRGWDVEFHGAKPSVHLIHEWPKNAIHVQAEKDLPFDTFTHVSFTYDGSGKAAGVKLYVNGQPVKTAVKQDGLTGTIRTEAPFSIGRRGDSGAPFTGRVDDLRIYGRGLDAREVASLGGAAQLEIVTIPAEQRTAEQKESLKKFFRESHAPYAAAQQKAADLKKEKEAFERQIPNTMVMAELEKPRDAFMRIRGAYDELGDKVSAAAPAFLPQLPAPEEGKRLTRLDFAQWLVSQEQPLTARVAVNRWWAMLFGTGIVKTLNDFGAQGEWPSHPELLEWLSADFMRDWDIKRAIKQMALSATYRQTARATPELLARDAENRLLARGPRMRLDAEFIRDNALAIGGILHRELGGRSIKPYQPPGIWEVNDMGSGKYEKSAGPDQYRRGLYVYWRRSTVYPEFITFDAPTREFCVAQRARTSTPLQSLVLMNDPVYVEAARAFAQRVLQDGGADKASRLAYMWRLALAREPSAEERAILERTLDQQLATYAEDKVAAEALLKIGDHPRPEALDASELAAWTATGNVILNLNETISN